MPASRITYSFLFLVLLLQAMGVEAATIYPINHASILSWSQKYSSKKVIYDGDVSEILELAPILQKK
jgi:hypothetical protein